MAQRVLDYIAENPERHDQDSVWSSGDYMPVENSCGTTMCIAGTALFLDALDKGKIQMIDNAPFCIRPYSDRDWDTKAAKLLGINEGTASRLFLTMNNENALLALKFIANGEEVPDGLLDNIE